MRRSQTIAVKAGTSSGTAPRPAISAALTIRVRNGREFEDERFYLCLVTCQKLLSRRSSFVGYIAKNLDDVRELVSV